MTARSPIVFLLDVDNTLLDNDLVIADLQAHLTKVFGSSSQREYWRIFEQLRDELGYADYLGTLQRFRGEHMHNPDFHKVALFLLDYPFSTRLYPGALAAVQHLRRLGPVAILSDGDVVFQPRKICRSGLLQAVADQVLIYIHKETELADVEAKYPADHYVLVDDKLRILNAVKERWGDRVTTVFARQGHYAHDPKILAATTPADLTVETIADLQQLSLADFTIQGE